MLRWGIPAYRLPRDILQAEIQDILDTGVELQTATRVGVEISMERILKEYYAVYIAIGAQKSMRLLIEGEEAGGVYGAIEMLRMINQDQRFDIGKTVVVIGGGNSAIDAARTALRLGASKVTIAYRRERKEMPALLEEIEAALDEGIELQEMVAPIRILQNNGKVSGIELRKMEPGEFDRTGRRIPRPLFGQEFTISADTVISAVSQEADLEFLDNNALEIDGSRIQVTGEQRTNLPRIWAGGDVVTGPAMVIDAIRAGQQAASDIDESIRAQRGEPGWVPPPEEKIELPNVVDNEVTESPQRPMPVLSPYSRARNFMEVEKGYSSKMALAEACRCIRCDAQND